MSTIASNVRFPRRWRRESTAEFASKTCYLARFCRKQYEHERNWTKRGRTSMTPPWICQCNQIFFRLSQSALILILNPSITLIPWHSCMSCHGQTNTWTRSCLCLVTWYVEFFSQLPFCRDNTWRSWSWFSLPMGGRLLWAILLSLSSETEGPLEFS